MTSFRLALRVGAIALSAIAGAYCGYQALALYLGNVPFHVPYWEATASAQAAANKRMVLGIYAFPLTVALLVILVFGHTLARTLRLLGIAALATALQCFYAAMWLPYGWGSGDKLSQAQRSHLALAFDGGAVAGLVGLLLLYCAFTARDYQDFLREKQTNQETRESGRGSGHH
jgi:hypothetical protein